MSAIESIENGCVLRCVRSSPHCARDWPAPLWARRKFRCRPTSLNSRLPSNHRKNAASIAYTKFSCRQERYCVSSSLRTAMCLRSRGHGPFMPNLRQSLGQVLRQLCRGSREPAVQTASMCKFHSPIWWCSRADICAPSQAALTCRRRSLGRRSGRFALMPAIHACRSSGCAPGAVPFGALLRRRRRQLQSRAATPADRSNGHQCGGRDRG